MYIASLNTVLIALLYIAIEIFLAGKKILKCKYYFDRGTRKSFITYKIGKIAGIYRPNRIRKVGEGLPSEIQTL